MKNILAIYSSITGENSVSNQLAKNWVGAQDATVVERDLARDVIPHLDGQTVGAFFTPEDQRSEEQSKMVELSDTLIDELSAADTIVIAAPMYNLGIPSNLKSWIDQIARAGKTFHYTENGPEGLMTGKKAIVVSARGGLYQGTGYDFQMPFIEQFLAFIGIKDVDVVYAEGISMGEDGRSKALSTANDELAAISA